MVDVFRIAILDYTPLEAKYREEVAKDILASAVREAVPEDYIVAIDYIRGFRDGIPDRKYDMFLISGSTLSTVGYSRDLDVALGQISDFIREVPTFGICFGLHAIARLCGNTSKMISDFEIGPKEVLLYDDIEGVGRCGDNLLFPVNHFYKIRNESGALKILAVSSGGIQIADASAHFGGNPVMGVQFHPEFAATPGGWKLFRRIHARTVEDVLSGEHAGVTLEPILRVLDKEVLRRLKELAPEPQRLIGRWLPEKERRAVTDLLMSPFHDMDFRMKLLGKKESERNHYAMRRNSCAMLRHFVKRALEAKNAVKQNADAPEERLDEPHGTQLEFSNLEGRAGADLSYRAEARKIFRRDIELRKRTERHFAKPARQMKMPL